MKARKYKFESSAIATPLIANINEQDICVVINDNVDFAMIPTPNPNFNPNLPIDVDTNYPLSQTAFSESMYCVDVLWANEPSESWAQYEIKVQPTALMIHKFDKFGLTREQLLPIMNEYLNNYNMSKLGTTHAMYFIDQKNPAWETGIIDEISSIHNNTLVKEGDNSYSVSISVFDGTTKNVNATCKLISNNKDDKFALYKYNSYNDYSKKENGILIFQLEPGRTKSHNIIVQNLDILEFRYVKAEGGQPSDRAHITNVSFI